MRIARHPASLLVHALRHLVGFMLGILLTTALYQLNGDDRGLADNDCVCGREGQEMRQLARLFLHSQSNYLPPSIYFQVQEEPPDSITAIKKFLYPPDEQPPILTGKAMKKRGFDSKANNEPKLLSHEYTMKKQLLVGVLTQQDYLSTRAKALYETWGQEVDKLVFFVGEDCNVTSDISHLPIIKLRGVPDRVYPPLLKAFAAVKYMYENYINEFNWFVRADDDMYVRTQKLADLLSKLVPYQHVYMGRAGAGRNEDLRRLQLLAHERYCMGGPGIFMSMYTLGSIGPHLDNCLRAVMYHDNHSKKDWSDDDVEIGRCLSRKIGVQCSTSKESRVYFKFDYSGNTLDPVTLWSSPKLQDLITIHPVKDPNSMYALHHFYKTLTFQKSYKDLQIMADNLNTLCSKLPSYVAPPRSISTSCDLKLHPHLEYFNDPNAHYNHLGNAPSMYFKDVDTVPFIYKSKNKFDLLPWIRFNSSQVQDVNSIFQQHPLGPRLQSELTSVMNTLRDYLRVAKAHDDEQITRLLDGYVRYNPLLGTEYVLSVKTSQQVFKKFRLVRELSPLVTVVESDISILEPAVHVILPLSTVFGQFEDFFNNYAQFGQRDNVKLIVVVFSDDDAENVRNVIKQVSMETSAGLVRVVVSDGKHDWLRGIEDGMASLKDDNSLAFLADVSVRFGPGFFRRCRINTIQNNQVYFPTAFWLYISEHQSHVSDDSVPDLNSWTGEWAGYKLWLVCIYKSDYMSVGGYHGSKYSVELFERVSKSHTEVIQAPDPGLFHLWSAQVCEGLKNPVRRKVCEGLKFHGIHEHVEMANYASELMLESNSLNLDNSGQWTL